MTENTTKAYLAKLPFDLRRITAELCIVARRNMPGADEMIYHDAVGYSINGSPFDRICYIAPQKGYVNFGFFFGVGLPDPKNYWRVHAHGCGMVNCEAWMKPSNTASPSTSTR